MAEEDMDEASDESEEEEADSAKVPPQRKPHAARITPSHTKGYDFSSCF